MESPELGLGYEDKAGGEEEKGASPAQDVDRAQTHHPPTRLGVEEQLLQTGNQGYGGGTLVCGGCHVALCH